MARVRAASSMTPGPRETAGPRRARARCRRSAKQRWPPVVCGTVHRGRGGAATCWAPAPAARRWLAPDGPGAGAARHSRWRSTGRSSSAGEYWRLLSCVFEHGSPLHLLFNMSVVYTLGFMLERAIGSWRFLGVCVVTALGALRLRALLQLRGAHGGRLGDDPRLGGGDAAHLHASRAAGISASGWCRWSVISLLPGVSWAGHLGGFLFGLPCGMALQMGGPVYARALPRHPLHHRGGGDVRRAPGTPVGLLTWRRAHVCVFCGSRPGARPEFLEAAQALGEELARRKLTLVYGGASVGLMGAVADAVLAGGRPGGGRAPLSLQQRGAGPPGPH